MRSSKARAQETPKTREQRQAELETELRRRVSEGALSRALFNSQVWNDKLKPYILKRIQALRVGGDWRPGKGVAKCEAIALGTVFNSGGVSELEALIEELENSAEQGREANEKLESIRRAKKVTEAT